MIGMAGGEYVFADLADSGNSLSTMNIPMEDLYTGVKDADAVSYTHLDVYKRQRQRIADHRGHPRQQQINKPGQIHPAGAVSYTHLPQGS